MTTEVLLAQFGMGMTEATALRWLKRVGETVREGQALVEFEAAKAIVEVVAPASGVLAKILVREGDTVPVYGVLAHID
jgi:pyruvate/2-oxoglutarate dehydrogenase complex dihydrolipoamide acyltransferase (E2) component